jgi:hypothetical protein
MRPLTLADVEAALYVNSPTGLRQLMAWLERRHKFTAEELRNYLSELLGKSKAIHRSIPFGGQMVDLYGLSGTWSG